MSWPLFVSLGGIPIALTAFAVAALIVWRVRDKRIVAALLLVTFFAGWMALTVPIALQVRKQASYENPNAAESEAALARNPNDAAAHMSLGSILRRQRHYEEAIPHFRTVMRLEPDNEMAALQLIASLHLAGRKEEERALLQELSKRNDRLGASAKKRLARLQAGTLGKPREYSR